MTPSVHEKLASLRNVVDTGEGKRKELAAMTDKTEADKKILESELATEMKGLLTTAIVDTKKNIKKYADALEEMPTTDEGIIQESELYEELLAAIIASGGTEAELPTYTQLLGLKPVSSAEELFTLDSDDTFLDKDEMVQSTYDETVDTESGLDSHVMSVFREYPDEVQLLNSPEELQQFLLSKWETVALPILRQKYAPAVSKSANEKVFSAGSSATGSGLEGFVSTKSVAQSELDAFYNAIAEVGGSVDDSFFLDKNGRLNEAEATSAIEEQVSKICGKIDPTQFEQYKQAIILPEAGSEQMGKKMAQWLEAVPEKFRGSDFEKKYTVYLEKSVKDRKYPKGFEEWLAERPKPGGIGGWIDTIKLLFTQSGLGKLLMDWFGEDTWIGKLIGLGDEDTKEDEVEDEAFKNQTTYTNPLAFKYVKDYVLIEELSSLDKWEGVSIKDINKDNLSAHKKELTDIKLILESTDPTMMLARKKGLTLDTLKKLNSMKESVILVPGKELFTLKGDIKKKEYTITNEGIGEASTLVETLNPDASDGETLLGAEYAAKFNLDKEFPSNAFTDSNDKKFDTLQPALKSLLKLDSKFWGTFTIDDGGIAKFLENMGGIIGALGTGKFRNIDTAFQPNSDASKFEVSTGTFRNLGGNPEYDSVEAFFKTLE
jgi:hypothetical protein